MRKRVSARLRYGLWAVVLVRLLVPVQLFTSPIAGTVVLLGSDPDQGIYTAPNPPAAPDNVLSLGGQDGPSVTLSNFPQAPNPPTLPDAPEPPAAPDLTKAPIWLGWTWLAGAAAVALILLVSNLRFYWKLRRERVPLEGVDCPLRVYTAVGLPSPCLFGIFRPAIYVTPEAAADQDMLRHVIAHEYTHYRQGDHLWSLLRCAALAAHWWNPLVWLAAVLSQRDAELACDEGALKRLGDGERAGYGNTLLTLVTAKPRPADLLRCATTMAGDKKSLKERISRIACAPKRVIWAVVVAVLVTALACVCAFGQAEETEETDQGDQHHQSEHLGPSVDTGAIPEEVLAAALEYTESMYEDFLGRLEIREPHVDNVAFDDWRVDALEGPWIRNAQGTEVGVWRLDYTCHTTTPERAKVLLAGGMTLTEDGWMTPTDSATWLIFLKGEDGKWRYSHAMQGDGSAQDQPDSDFFWTRATNGIPNVTDPHFTADMTGIPGDVLSLAAFYGQDRLAACQVAAWSFATLPDGVTPEPGQIEFDDWRITSLKGPWR
ncbi:MAG: M56 family metallopeptidase, partial [Oscillospiraceae bacterium]|nr:M56 family metallopeptidase [Oscillospiraceae bacterium]